MRKLNKLCNSSWVKSYAPFWYWKWYEVFISTYTSFFWLPTKHNTVMPIKLVNNLCFGRESRLQLCEQEINVYGV